MMLNLLVRTKIGDTLQVSHNGDMASFMAQFQAMRCITTPDGSWIPMDSISHIVPQVTPQVPTDALQQVPQDGEMRN
jgi:hypothetical protein